MSKEQFNQKLVETFTVEEYALINSNIYLNSDHISYWKNYQAGEYEKCFDYLMKKRSLLTLDHTPAKHLKFAKEQINVAKAMLDTSDDEKDSE